jgi:uncharacterized membrane protein YsdA (DUF1294 family)
MEVNMPEFLTKNIPLTILLAYIALISLISIIVCIYDKKISKKNRVELRIPEKTLLVLSALGGSVAMFITMLLIRHKTKHVKFMLGIPLIILVQAAAVFALFYFKVI